MERVTSGYVYEFVMTDENGREWKVEALNFDGAEQVWRSQHPDLRLCVIEWGDRVS